MVRPIESLSLRGFNKQRMKNPDYTGRFPFHYGLLLSFNRFLTIVPTTIPRIAPIISPRINPGTPARVAPTIPPINKPIIMPKRVYESIDLRGQRNPELPLLSLIQ